MMLDGLYLYFYLLVWYEDTIIKWTSEPVYKVTEFFKEGTDMSDVRVLAQRHGSHIKSLPAYKEEISNYNSPEHKVMILFEAEELTAWSLEDDE